MMHFARTLLIGLLLTLGSILPTWGQDAGDGSIYSRFGIGELRTSSSAQAQALGGDGVALRSLNYTNISNPALWSDQVLTRVALGARFRTVESEGGQSEGTSRLTAGNFDGVQFSFPLLRQKLGVAFGFVPVSQSNFRSRVQRTTSSTPFDETLDYQVEFLGRGGLQKITGGFGYRFNDLISVGASLDYLFGTIETQRRTSFTRPNFQETVVTNGVRLDALSATLGTHLTIGDLLRPEDNLMIGAAVALPTRLSGTRTRTIGESLDRDTVSTASGGALDMPFTARLGAAYVPSSALTLTVNGSYAPWSQAESSMIDDDVAFAFPVGGTETLSDQWTLSSGVEWRPAGDDSFRGFLARTAYRLGVSYEQLYVSPNTETTLNAMEARFGISLPTSVSGTRIDLTTHVGRQGTTSQNLVQDLYYGVSASVTIGERWFQERRLR